MQEGTVGPLAREMMAEFARRTGLFPARESPRRYLWTDAFAVCNFLGLYIQTGQEGYKRLALDLIDQVHNTLGRHREDDSRKGSISGLDEDERRLHPTRGGLRIGKALNERKPVDPFDEAMEWDRDGQYFHYLTKWMHALDRVSAVTRDYTYNRWAVELAGAVHSRFVYVPPWGGQKLMCWKMSIDLSYPLVPSMGHHDPLDGLVTYCQLQASAVRDPERPAADLRAAISDMISICEGRDWTTDDPLGIGGLLFDASRLTRLIVDGDFKTIQLLEALLEAALVGLESFVRQNPLKHPTDYRLAFRELGLSIGLKAVDPMERLMAVNPNPFKKSRTLSMQIDRLKRYAPLGQTIEKFWSEGASRETDSWIAHGDINMVMLATSLAPAGFLPV